MTIHPTYKWWSKALTSEMTLAVTIHWLHLSALKLLILSGYAWLITCTVLVFCVNWQDSPRQLQTSCRFFFSRFTPKPCRTVVICRQETHALCISTHVRGWKTGKRSPASSEAVPAPAIRTFKECSPCFWSGSSNRQKVSPTKSEIVLGNPTKSVVFKDARRLVIITPLLMDLVFQAGPWGWLGELWSHGFSVLVWKMEQLMASRFENESESSTLALYTVYKLSLQETKCGFAKVTNTILGVLTVPVASSRDCHPWVQSHQWWFPPDHRDRLPHGW